MIDVTYMISLDHHRSRLTAARVARAPMRYCRLSEQKLHGGRRERAISAASAPRRSRRPVRRSRKKTTPPSGSVQRRRVCHISDSDTMLPRASWARRRGHEFRPVVVLYDFSMPRRSQRPDARAYFSRRWAYIEDFFSLPTYAQAARFSTAEDHYGHIPLLDAGGGDARRAAT